MTAQRSTSWPKTVALRWLPHDEPPWDIVSAQTRRWLNASVFEALVADLRVLLRLAAGRSGQPSAAILRFDISER